MIPVTTHQNTGQGWWNESPVAATVITPSGGSPPADNVVAYGGNRTHGPLDVATTCRAKGGTGHEDFESETFIVPVVAGPMSSNSGTERKHGHGMGQQDWENGYAIPIPVAFSSMAVRRLTPTECSRLQSFPDDYTLIPYRGKPAADGNRYKAIGNSMTTTVIRYLGRRIQSVLRGTP